MDLIKHIFKLFMLPIVICCDYLIWNTFVLTNLKGFKKVSLKESTNQAYKLMFKKEKN